MRGFYQAISDAFPGCHVETEQLLVEGDHLTWRLRSPGPTGATSRACRPAGLLLMQIGAIPAPAPAIVTRGETGLFAVA